MNPLESNTSNHAVAIATIIPPILSIPTSKSHTTTPPSPSTTTLSPPRSPLSSTPEVVDSVRCNHQKFWKSLTRNLLRYLGCFKAMELEEKSGSKEFKGGFKDDNFCSWSGSSSVPQSPNYYSEMNAEEREEKLESAISYCRGSSFMQDGTQQV